ncbi:hypothetical protein [Kitasatospora sp. MBT63]|uniref:hypothetical protein n=1 Tax=Kitasatospora sp. MBT63 TaxID=1444768 RepID=UPI00053A0520|nr:hypothetical protein [Kitasatospora sp. MBT63]
MTTPPRPDYAPTPGLVTTWSDYTRQAAPGGTTVVHHHYAAPATAPVIPTLAPDHHNTVDWARVRRAIRVCVTPASVTGAVFSPAWAHWALPLAATKGLTVAVGLDVLTALLTGIAVGLGYLPRPLATAVLVAAGLGTVELIPLTVAYWITER